MLWQSNNIKHNFVYIKLIYNDRYLLYICNKCNLEAIKYLHEFGPITIRDNNYYNLTCEEIIIKNIIE